MKMAEKFEEAKPLTGKFDTKVNRIAVSKNVDAFKLVILLRKKT